MKIKITGLVAFLILSLNAYSQLKEQQFSDAVNYVNCKCVELSLIKSPTKGVTFAFQSQCNCEDAPDYNYINQAIPTTESKTTELSKEIESIKINEFKSGLKVEDAVKLLTETIFSNQKKYAKLFAFAENRKKDTDFNPFTSELKTHLAKLFATDNTTQLPSTVNTQAQETLPESTIQSVEERVNDLERKMNSNENSKGWFDGFTFQIDVFSILITLLSIFLLVRYLFRVSNEPNSPQNEVTSLSNNDKNWVVKKIKEQTPDFSFQFSNSREKKELISKIEALENQVRELKGKISAKEVDFEIVQPKYETKTPQEYKQPETKQNFETFYLSGPNLDGTFNVSSAQTIYKDGASIYRLQKTSANRAVFQIEDKEQALSLALSYPERTIDPVCESSNPFNSSSRKIFTEKVGEVELVDDKWKLIRKAKIRYES